MQSVAIRFHHSPYDSENSQLAYILHTADILAKSAGYVAGTPGQVTDIDPDILGYLKLDPQDLETIAIAIIDDVQKIEKEVEEA